MNQFSTQVDEQGNLLITPGMVIDTTAATTAYYPLGVNLLNSIGRGQGLRQSSPYAPFFVGGSGESVEITGTVTTPAIAPIGYFQRTGEFEWTDRFGNVLTMLSDYSDGDISDATDVIATLSAPPSGGLIDPWIFNATTYGEDEFNGGTPFDFTVLFEARRAASIANLAYVSASVIVSPLYQTSPTTWEDGAYILTIAEDLSSGSLADGGGDIALMSLPLFFESTVYGETTYNSGSPFEIYADFVAGTSSTDLTTITISQGTAQSGDYTATAWNEWTSVTDSSWTITINNDTTADIEDGTNIVATRVAGSARIPSGVYQSTTYGANTYNDGASFIAAIGFETRLPLAGFAYVEIELLSGAFVEARGPYFAASLPANSSTLEVIPICHSNGSGIVTPIHDGPIIFR